MQKLVGAARERMRYSEEGKRTYERLAQEAYKHYRSYLNKEKNPFPVDIYDPRLFSTINTTRSRILQALFQSFPFLRYLPRNSSDTAAAEAMTSLVAYHLGEMKQPTCRELLGEILLGLDLCGTQYVSVFWNVQEREVMTREQVPVTQMVTVADPMTGMPVEVPVDVLEERDVSRRMTVVDSPWFEPLHFTECFPDHSEPHVQSGEFFLIRKLRTRSYLKQKARTGEWNKSAVGKAMKDQPLAETDGWKDLTNLIDWQSSIGIDTTRQTDAIKAGELFEVLEMWHKYGSRVTVIINRQHVVRHGRNPYPHGQFPVLHLKKYELQREHYAMSIFEVTRWLLRSLQVMRGATASEVLLSVFPPLMVTPNAVRDVERDLTYGFKSIWRVNNMDGLRYMQRPNVGAQAASALIQDYQNTMDDALGTQDAFRGGLTDPDQKATSVSIAIQGAGIRLQNDIDNLEQQFVVPLGDFYQQMIRAWQDYDVAVRVVEDPQGPAVMAEMAKLRDLDFDVIPTASANQTAELEKKRTLEMWQAGLQAQEPNMDRRGAFEVVIDKIVGGKYKSKFLKSEQKIAMEQQQAMMQQMAAAGMAMPQGPATPTLPDGGAGEMAAELAEVVQ